MEPVPSNLPDAPTDAPVQPPEPQVEDRTRRNFLQGSARKLAYAAPLVLLFHPTPACASNGSKLTGNP